jgi:hypothetical protein
MMTRSAPAAAAAAILLSILTFVWFAGDGLAAYFTPDDMMNLYGAWDHPWASDRLAGTLFYNLAFKVLGFEPLGYRIVCWLLLAGNLALLYCFALRLARSTFVAGLTCLLGAYHAHLADLYYSTGTIYDLLCYTFWLGAFVWYAWVRERGEWPGWGQSAALIVLYAAALNAKEMAVTLPAFVVLYELLYHTREKGWTRWRFVMLAIPVTAAFLAWKLGGPGRMADNPAYAIELKTAVFLRNWRHFLNDLFYGLVEFKAVGVWLFWALSLVAAVVLRRREMVFGWVLFFVGAGPVVFLPERGLYVLYVVLPGFYLYGASLLDAVIPKRVPYREIAAVLLVAAVLAPLHTKQKPKGKAWVAEAFDSIRVLRTQLKDRCPTMPRSARVLFTTDPYPADDWIVTFIFRLHYRDRELVVDREKQTPGKTQPPETYNYVFAMEKGELRQLRP